MKEPIIGLPCVKDSNGAIWYFLEGKQRIVIWDDTKNDFIEGGYMCNSLEDGIDFLREDGFITKEDYKKSILLTWNRKG